MTEIWSNEPLEKNGEWFIIVVDADTQEYLREEGPFATKAACIAAISKNKTKTLKELEREKDNSLKSETVLLEQMLGVDKVQEFKRDGILPKTPEELELELEQFKTEFEEEEEICLNDAKSLLLGIATVYLKGKFIKDTDYLKFKLKLESEGLGNVLFQLKTSRRAIYKISQEIHLGTATTRMVEVLTGLQRVVLDISKFQHQYMISLEDSMKKLAADNDDIESKSTEIISIDGKPVENSTDVKQKPGAMALTTASRKTLMNNLNNFLEESKVELKTPKSKNTKLHDDDPDVIEVQEEIIHKDDEESDEITGKTGLETFDDDQD